MPHRVLLLALNVIQVAFNLQMQVLQYPRKGWVVRVVGVSNLHIHRTNFGPLKQDLGDVNVP